MFSSIPTNNFPFKIKQRLVNNLYKSADFKSDITLEQSNSDVICNFSNKSSIHFTQKQAALVYKPPAFRPKIVYSYVIEVADYESGLGLHGKALVLEIFAFYHLEYARGRPGRRCHVHIGQNLFDVLESYKSL